MRTCKRMTSQRSEKEIGCEDHSGHLTSQPKGKNAQATCPSPSRMGGL